IINENPLVITNESVKTIIYRKRRFFNNVYDLAKIFIPIKDAIIKLESRNATLADCYFLLISLRNAIHKMPKEIYKHFHQHAIKVFNSRFEEFEFDKYL
ncbi:15565_t:CDS:1, partial [Racocetra fulgida]